MQNPLPPNIKERVNAPAMIHSPFQDAKVIAHQA
jgi:hypothetical protein